MLRHQPAPRLRSAACGAGYPAVWSIALALRAASQGNALDSAALMLAFGLAPLPVLLATGLLPNA